MFVPPDVHEIELKRFKNNVEAIKHYTVGKADILASGIIHFLRIFSRPFTRDGGANPYTAAYNAAFCEGYNKALDDLIYFEEQYLTETPGRKPITATFGALGIALERGDLTEKDITNGKLRR